MTQHFGTTTTLINQWLARNADHPSIVVFTAVLHATGSLLYSMVPQHYAFPFVRATMPNSKWTSALLWSLVEGFPCVSTCLLAGHAEAGGTHRTNTAAHDPRPVRLRKFGPQVSTLSDGLHLVVHKVLEMPRLASLIKVALRLPCTARSHVKSTAEDSTSG